MIKRIIFDVDDTLIPWENKYWNTLKDTLIYFEIEPKEELFSKLKEAVDNYENEYNTYSMKAMKELMEKYSGIKLPSNFVYRWSIFLRRSVPNSYDTNLINILEYLKEKYDLVVLTNWFTVQQAKRLKNYGILKYFTRVIGTDNVLNKPNAEAYLEACKPYKPYECLFVSDSYETDIKGAIDSGLKAVLYSSKFEEKDNYIIIDDLNKLKDLL